MEAAIHDYYEAIEELREQLNPNYFSTEQIQREISQNQQ